MGYLSFELLITIPILNNTQISEKSYGLVHISVSATKTTPQHARLSPFSVVYITPSFPLLHREPDLCVASQYSCKEQQSSFKGETVPHTFWGSHGSARLTFLWNVAVICISPLNLYLASVHAQLRFSALALVRLQAYLKDTLTSLSITTKKSDRYLLSGSLGN